MADQAPDLQLKRAEWYAQQMGWAVFPVHIPNEDGSCSCERPDCTNIGKHPLWHAEDLMNGVLDATTDVELIRRWWARWPNANIGIATGARSGIFVLDVDPQHGGDDSLSDLIAKCGRFDDTVICLTPSGGQHFYFKHPGWAVPNRSGLLPGIDIRGEGGYVVAPMSQQVRGIYRFEVSSEPQDVPLRNAPTPLLSELKPAPITATKAPTKTKESIPAGERNSTLTRIAGQMRRHGMDEEEILAALRTANQRRCSPPLDDREVERIAGSIAKYAPSEATEWRIGSSRDLGSPTEFTGLKPLRYLGGDPPYWEATVRGQKLKLSHEQLHKFPLFKLVCHAKLFFVPVIPNGQGDDGKPLTQQTTWEKEWLNPALEAMELDGAIEEAPEDASDLGAAWKACHAFLSETRASTKCEHIEKGTSELVCCNGYFYFRGHALRQWISKNCPLKIKPTDLWQAVKNKGGKNHEIRIGPRIVNVWSIPLAPEGSPDFVSSVIWSDD